MGAQIFPPQSFQPHPRPPVLARPLGEPCPVLVSRTRHGQRSAMYLRPRPQRPRLLSGGDHVGMGRRSWNDACVYWIDGALEAVCGEEEGKGK
jgi:hypothetical protein